VGPNRRPDKESLTAAMNMVKQGGGANHLTLLRNFQQSSKTVDYARPCCVFFTLDVIFFDVI